MIRNFKYILIALVLISNLWGQKELIGVWSEDTKTLYNGDYLNIIEISGSKTLTLTKYKCVYQNGDDDNFLKLEKGSSYAVVDAWFGDSYIVDRVRINQVSGKREEIYEYIQVIETGKELIPDKDKQKVFSNIRIFESDFPTILFKNKKYRNYDTGSPQGALDLYKREYLYIERLNEFQENKP